MLRDVLNIMAASPPDLPLVDIVNDELIYWYPSEHWHGTGRKWGLWRSDLSWVKFLKHAASPEDRRGIARLNLEMYSGRCATCASKHIHYQVSFSTILSSERAYPASSFPSLPTPPILHKTLKLASLGFGVPGRFVALALRDTSDDLTLCQVGNESYVP